MTPFLPSFVQSFGSATAAIVALLFAIVFVGFCEALRQELMLKNHRGLGPPVGRETARGYLCRGRERPSAFWWRVTPLKNMVHGLLRA